MYSQEASPLPASLSEMSMSKPEEPSQVLAAGLLNATDGGVKSMLNVRAASVVTLLRLSVARTVTRQISVPSSGQYVLDPTVMLADVALLHVRVESVHACVTTHDDPL